MTDSSTPASFDITPEQGALLDRLAEQVRAGLRDAAAPADPSAPPTTPDPEAGTFRRILRDIGTGIAEAPGQITRGALDAADAASNFVWSGVQGAADAVGAGGLVRSIPRTQLGPAAASTGFVGGEAQSVTGGLVNEVSQFAAGYVGIGAVARMAGIANATTTVGQIMQGAGRGGFTDALAFNGQEARLSNLIEQYPQLSNPVTRYLAAQPGDSEAEGRFKNALEGLGIGAAVEGLIAGVRALRAARSGDHVAAQAAAEEAAQAAPVRDPLTDPNVARQMDEEAWQEFDPLAGRRESNDPGAPDATDARLEGEPSGPRLETPEGTPPRAPEGEAPNAPREGADSGAEVPPGPAAQPTYAPRVLVDDTALRDIVTQYQREAGFGMDRNLSGIRTDLIEGSQDVNHTLSAIRMAVREQMDTVDPAGAVGTVRTLEEVRRNADTLAHDIGGEPDLFFHRLAAQADNTRHLDAEVTTYRIFITSIHDRVTSYARALNDATGNDLAGFGSRAELGEQFRRHVELLANVSALYRGVQTNIARSLNAMRLTVRPAEDMMRELHNIDAMAARFAMADDVSQSVRLASGGRGRNALGAVNEYWVNSVLSGPKTQMVNIVSNLATAALQPAERMIAGALGGGREEFIQGGLQYVGLAQSLREAVTLAARAFREGDAILDPFRSTVEMQGRHAISAQRFGLDGADVRSDIVDWLGTVIRVPSRLLMTQDEFFKQLTYRARIRAGAWREATASGHEWGGDAFADFVQRRMDGAFHPDGRAVHEEALAAARNVTFTDDLAAQRWSWTGDRTFGETLQNTTATHPFLTVVLPFIRTPTNILRFVWDRTPGLNVLRAQYSNDLFGRNGAEAMARARAQMVTGGMLYGAAATFALDGTITGGGPTDPMIQRQLRATGWQPYSIRTRNADGTVTYRAYDRADPFGMFFGLTADFTERAGYMNERGLEQVATDMMISLARQLQNKTYLSGLTRAITALAEPDRRGEKFFQGLAGSFIPSAVSQTIRNDPHMREVRSVLDAVRNRLPGNEGLDPVRNVLGEAVSPPPGWGPDWLSPIAQTTRPGGSQPVTREWRNEVQSDVHSEIARQLVRHNQALRPPAPEVGTVDMREFRHPETQRTAYDRYQELTGTVTIGGVTLKQRLEALIASDTYRNSATDGTFDHDGSRIDIIRSVVGAYRQMAERQLRREMPDLHRALLNEQRTRALTRVPQRAQ